MAELDYEFSEDCEVLTWSWTGVPTDDSAPGRDNYFVSVYDNVTGEELVWVPGAEDNAWGEPYSVGVIPGHDVYLFVSNEAHAFYFETDAVVSCETEIETVTTTTVAEPAYIPTETVWDPIMTIVMTIWGIAYRIGRLLAF